MITGQICAQTEPQQKICDFSIYSDWINWEDNWDHRAIGKSDSGDLTKEDFAKVVHINEDEVSDKHSNSNFFEKTWNFACLDLKFGFYMKNLGEDGEREISKRAVLEIIEKTVPQWQHCRNGNIAATATSLQWQHHAGQHTPKVEGAQVVLPVHSTNPTRSPATLLTPATNPGT